MIIDLERLIMLLIISLIGCGILFAYALYQDSLFLIFLAIFLAVMLFSILSIIYQKLDDEKRSNIQTSATPKTN